MQRGVLRFVHQLTIASRIPFDLISEITHHQLNGFGRRTSKVFVLKLQISERSLRLVMCDEQLKWDPAKTVIE